MKSRRGLTLIEILLSIALLGIIAAMLMPGLTNQYSMLVQTRKMTEDLYAAQQSAEQTITDVRTAIQSGTSPSGQTRTAYILFQGTANQRTVYGYPNQFAIHVGNNTVNLDTIVADNRMPEFAVATATGVGISLTDGTNTLPFAYAGTNLLQVASSFTLVDPSNVNLTNINRWYVSREGFNIPMVTGAQEIEKGTIYPRFPDDYVLIKGESGYSLATILSTYAGRHIVYTITPASTTGKMGDTVVSNPVFINGLPVISNLMLHLDASMISKEDSSAVVSATTTVNGVPVTTFSVKKWTDLSGNTNNAVQSTTSLQPKLIEADMGSFASGNNQYETYAKYVQFDGSKGLTVADANSLDQNNMTVIVVARSAATTSGKTIVSKLSSTTGWSVGWTSSNQLGWYIKNSSGTNSLSTDANVALDGGWHILMGSASTSGLNLQMDDGTAKTGTRTIGSAITNSTALSIGFNGSTNYSNVDVAEIILYSGTLSTTDSASVLTYLENKYEPVPPVNGIYSLKPIVDNAVKGENYTLPSTVQAYMTNGTMQNVAVVWVPTTADTSTTGTKVYTATAVADGTKTTTLTLNVQGIARLEDFSTTVEKGLPFTLPATVVADLVDGSKRYVAVTWNINNVDTSIVGTVTRTGTAVLDPTKTMTLTLTVGPRRVTSVGLDLHAYTLNVGSGFQLNQTVLPASADNQNVGWSTSDASVATVNASGRVTAVGSGSATITVTTMDGGFTDTCLVTVNVPVTDVTLNRSVVTVPLNGTSQLTATIAPANASNQNVVWTSSNTNVATVSTSGLVTVKSNATIGGTTIITVTTSDGSFTDTCTVTAGTPVTGVTLNVSTRTVNKGATYQLVATVAPSGATVKGVSWSSSDPSVATVSSSGLVTGLTNGTATIMVTTVDGGFTDDCLVTVNVPVTGVTLNVSSVILNRSNTYQLIATVAPADATNPSVTWSTSNSNVATVSTSGLVTVKGTATLGSNCTITVTTVVGGYTDTTTVTVRNPVTGVTLNVATRTVNKGATYQLVATIVPSGASVTDVTWSSNNPSVASVSSSGLVTGVANGTATITVTTVDGGFSATCFVTVNVPVTDVTLNRSAVTVPRSGTSQLTATIAPANASNQNVTWTSSNTNVATVGTSGLVTVKSNATIGGTTVITVTTSDGSFTDTCTVTAGIAVTGITLNNSTLSINQGSTATLTWTFIPSNATVQTVNWISSNTSVATVSRTGVVTAVGGGVATVTVTTTEGGFTDTCAVSVPVWATGISGNTTSVTITFNETITSADFNPTFAGYSTSVSGNTVIFTRTSGTFQLNTNYFVLVYGSDGTSRTITIKRTGNKSWTVAN